MGCRHGASLRLLAGRPGVECRVALHLTPAGTILASANADGTIRLGGVYGRETLRVDAHRGRVIDVTFSPDSRRLASVSREETTVAVWDADTGRNLLTLRGYNHPLTGVTYSPDGRLLPPRGSRAW